MKAGVLLIFYFILLTSFIVCISGWDSTLSQPPRLSFPWHTVCTLRTPVDVTYQKLFILLITLVHIQHNSMTYRYIWNDHQNNQAKKLKEWRRMANGSLELHVFFFSFLIEILSRKWVYYSLYRSSLHVLIKAWGLLEGYFPVEETWANFYGFYWSLSEAWHHIPKLSLWAY